MPIDHCADRMGLASQQVMPKELRGASPSWRNLIDFGKKAGEVPEGQVELMWLELAERTCRRPCSEATSIR